MQTESNHILAVRVPSLEGVDYISMWDGVLESVRLGALILEQDDTLEVMELALFVDAAIVEPAEAGKR